MRPARNGPFMVEQSLGPLCFEILYINALQAKNDLRNAGENGRGISAQMHSFRAKC